MSYSVSNSLIVTDLDGTLLKNDKSISQKNLITLQEWTNCGGDFAIATGRSIISASHRISQLPITCSSIVFNGGILYDYLKNSIEYQRDLPASYREVVATMLTLYPEIGVEIMTKDIIYLPARNEIVERHMARESLENEDRDISDLPASGASKVLFGVPSHQVDSFLKEIQTCLPDEIYPVRTDENYCEIMPKNIDKGSGLNKLKQLTQKRWECVIAFGDFFNDIPLFESATVSLATANAPDEVKRFADFIVSSNEEDAIAYGINLLSERGILKK